MRAQGIKGGGEGVQRGVLREDTRGRVSARLCRLALTATDAGLKWESSWAACLPIQQENKSHVEEPLCGIRDSRLTPQIHWGRPRAPTRQHNPPPFLSVLLLLLLLLSGLMLRCLLANSKIQEIEDCWSHCFTFKRILEKIYLEVLDKFLEQKIVLSVCTGSDTVKTNV